MGDSPPTDGPQQDSRWYDLFSRGARDWLRHNEKVREAVRENLPRLLSGADVIGGSGEQIVRVPVRFLEHYRLRLRDTDSQQGVGQGEAKPGDVLRQKQAPGQGGDKGPGGSEGGGLEFVLELKVDDIVDWLWEELQLPNLQAKSGSVEQDEYKREGWNRRGARSRLDRRRSLKEAIKRRSVQPEGPPFTDDDLRYRQLIKRQQPATQAVVFFGLDVSASMTEPDRQLAKTFFFWVIQGLRRQYTRIETVFVAHTTEAWEFAEEEFFQVRGSGGTIASTAFRTVNEIVAERYDPSRYNVYLFYASDGENFPNDREEALQALSELAPVANYLGYVEVTQQPQQSLATQTADLFKRLLSHGLPVGTYALKEPGDVWDAIRAFFQRQAAEA